jgi:hypothetical protein
MAKIRTTYSMRRDVVALLEAAEEKTGIPWILLLVRAVQKLVKHSRKYIQFSGRIRYQKRFDENTKLPIPKKRVKARLLEGEYYYFQDLRRVCVLSISHVLAIAVFTYLKEVVDEIMTSINNGDENGDNYPLVNYAIIEKCIENITTFRFWWGVPEDLELLLTR